MADWSQWIELELTDEEKLDDAMPMMPLGRGPHFPPGTTMCLDEKILAKAGLPVPELGAILDARIMFKVTSVSQNDDTYGERCRIEIQAIRLKLEDEDAEMAGDGGEAGE